MASPCACTVEEKAIHQIDPKGWTRHVFTFENGFQVKETMIYVNDVEKFFRTLNPKMTCNGKQLYLS